MIIIFNFPEDKWGRLGFTGLSTLAYHILFAVYIIRFPAHVKYLDGKYCLEMSIPKSSRHDYTGLNNMKSTFCQVKDLVKMVFKIFR